MIVAWSTIPDYMTLGLGTSAREHELDNTCAGISAKQTLQSVVKVGQTKSEHLEIVVMDQRLPPKLFRPVLVELEKKYGSQGRSHSRKEKLE